MTGLGKLVLELLGVKMRLVLEAGAAAAVVVVVAVERSSEGERGLSSISSACKYCCRNRFGGWLNIRGSLPSWRFSRTFSLSLLVGADDLTTTRRLYETSGHCDSRSSPRIYPGTYRRRRRRHLLRQDKDEREEATTATVMLGIARSPATCTPATRTPPAPPARAGSGGRGAFPGPPTGQS